MNIGIWAPLGPFGTLGPYLFSYLGPLWALLGPLDLWTLWAFWDPWTFWTLWAFWDPWTFLDPMGPLGPLALN